MTGSALWYATRGAGVVSLVLLTGVVLLGVLSALRWSHPVWPRVLTAGLHRNLALLAVVFLALHIVTAVVDPFTALGFGAAAVPFSSPYRRLWLGLGAVAVDLMLAVLVTSLLRRRLGHRVWRTVHWLAYASWPVALLHGMGTGTDAGTPWMVEIDIACVTAVVVAVAWRAGVRRLDRRPAPVALEVRR